MYIQADTYTHIYMYILLFYICVSEKSTAIKSELAHLPIKPTHLNTAPQINS